MSFLLKVNKLSTKALVIVSESKHMFCYIVKNYFTNPLYDVFSINIFANKHIQSSVLVYAS